MEPRTVNQALDKLYSDFKSEEVVANPELSELKEHLLSAKFKLGGNHFLPNPEWTISVLNRGHQNAA